MKKESKSDAPIKNNGVLGDFPLTGCDLDVDIQNAYLAKAMHQNFFERRDIFKETSLLFKVFRQPTYLLKFHRKWTILFLQLNDRITC